MVRRGGFDSLLTYNVPRGTIAIVRKIKDKEIMTVLQGEEMQSRDLLKWRELLQQEPFEALRIYARKDNYKATSGYDICRGQQLSTFVENYLYFKREGRLEKELGLRGYEELKSFGFRGIE